MLRQQLIGLSLIPSAVCGCLFNGTIVYIVFRFRTLHRPFSILTATLAACHEVTSLTTSLFIIPMIVLDISYLEQHSSICGFIALLCYEISSMTHLSIAINRFVAVFIPFSYNTVYNPRTIKLLIPMILIVSVVIITTYSMLLDCQMEYYKENWIFLITDTRKCEVTGWTMIFGKNLLFSALDIVLHLITLVKVMSMKRSAKTGRTSESHRLQESYFLKQTFCQTVLMSLELIAYTVPFENISRDFVSFLLSLFLWSTLHAAEGLVTLVYNSEIRRKLQKRKKSYRISVIKVDQTTAMAN